MQTNSRRLSPTFVEDLRAGLLSPLCDRIRRDASLDLQFRRDHVNVYYRGGSLAKISPHHAGGYVAKFDEKYFRDEPPENLPSRLGRPSDVLDWLHALPLLKDAMDCFEMSEEREVQQQLVRDNNLPKTARSTDYYICDVEYPFARKRFDFVGVRWPATATARKATKGHRLFLGELKLGDDALRGSSGVQGHVRDASEFFGSAERVRKLEGECLESFALKRELQLLNFDKDLESFGDEPPLLLLAFANHTPNSTVLRDVLRELPTHAHFEIRIMRSCLMGYGLFDRWSMSLEEARASL